MKPITTSHQVQAPDTSSDAERPHTPAHRWAALMTLAVGLALIVIDGTIVGVALPQIIGDLRLDLTEAQWVNSLYSVVFAALLLGFGSWGDRHGRRRLFTVGIVVFTLGSAAAAFASAAGPMLLARALQGVGGAMILPATLSTVNATFHGRDRAVAFGIWGAVMSGAAALGPLLGGALTTYASWRWVFIVNLPLGALVLLATVRYVPETRGGFTHRHDLLGNVFAALGLGLLVFGFIEANTLGWWRPMEALTIGGVTWPVSAPISAAPVAMMLGAVFLAALLVRERRLTLADAGPLLDLRLFRLPTFAWGNVAAGCVAIGEFALVFVLPLFLSIALHQDAMTSGFVLAAMALGAFFAGAQARHAAARFGAPTVVLIGLGLEVVGVAAIAWVLTPSVSLCLLAACLFVYGVGLGFASAQLTSTVLRDVPVEQSGMGSATQSSVRQIGAALGSALAGSMLAVGLGSASLGADADTFAHATTLAILLAGGFLMLGFVAATQVARAAKA